MKIDTIARFPLGRIFVTPAALAAVHSDDLSHSLVRHATGDWGECDQEDWIANETSLRNGLRLLSVYRDRDQTKFWIITEADRSSTTLLLPEDY